MNDERNARERLVEAAGTLFHQRSYRSVGVAEICTVAEVTKGSFYHFFPSKEALASAVIDARWERMQAHLSAVFDAPGSARDRLIGFFQGIAQACRAQKAQHGKLLGCPFGNLASELSTTDAMLRERLTSVLDDVRARFERLVRDGVEAGEIPSSIDAPSAALALSALFQGLMILGKTYNDPSLAQTLEAQALILAGLS